MFDQTQVLALLMLVSYKCHKLVEYDPWNRPNCTFCSKRSVITSRSFSACSNIGCIAGFIIKLLTGEFSPSSINLYPHETQIIVDMLRLIASKHPHITSVCKKPNDFWKGKPFVANERREWVKAMLIKIMIKVLTKFLVHQMNDAKDTADYYKELSFDYENNNSSEFDKCINNELAIRGMIQKVLDGRSLHVPRFSQLIQQQIKNRDDNDLRSSLLDYRTTRANSCSIAAMVVCRLFFDLNKPQTVQKFVKDPLFDKNLVETICSFHGNSRQHKRLCGLVGATQLILNEHKEMEQVGMDRWFTSIVQVGLNVVSNVSG